MLGSSDFRMSGTARLVSHHVAGHVDVERPAEDLVGRAVEVVVGQHVRSRATTGMRRVRSTRRMSLKGGT